MKSEYAYDIWFPSSKFNFNRVLFRLVPFYNVLVRCIVSFCKIILERRPRDHVHIEGCKCTAKGKSSASPDETPAQEHPWRAAEAQLKSRRSPGAKKRGGGIPTDLRGWLTESKLLKVRKSWKVCKRATVNDAHLCTAPNSRKYQTFGKKSGICWWIFRSSCDFEVNFVDFRSDFDVISS